MDEIKLTEKEISHEASDDLRLVITQTEEVDGEHIEAVRRITPMDAGIGIAEFVTGRTVGGIVLSESQYAALVDAGRVDPQTLYLCYEDES